MRGEYGGNLVRRVAPMPKIVCDRRVQFMEPNVDKLRAREDQSGIWEVL